jgi:hypothetical protein
MKLNLNPIITLFIFLFIYFGISAQDITYVSENRLLTCNTDGSNKQVLVSSNMYWDINSPRWSHNGQHIYFCGRTGAFQWKIEKLNVSTRQISTLYVFNDNPNQSSNSSLSELSFDTNENLFLFKLGRCLLPCNHINNWVFNVLMLDTRTHQVSTYPQYKTAVFSSDIPNFFAYTSNTQPAVSGIYDMTSQQSFPFYTFPGGFGSNALYDETSPLKWGSPYVITAQKNLTTNGINSVCSIDLENNVVSYPLTAQNNRISNISTVRESQSYLLTIGTNTLRYIKLNSNGSIQQNNFIDYSSEADLKNLKQIVSNTNDTDYAKDIVLYPNPFTDQVYIRNSDNFSRGFIIVYDLQGREIMRSDLNQQSINLQGKKNGLYIFKLFFEDTDTIQTFKMLKM